MDVNVGYDLIIVCSRNKMNFTYISTDNTKINMAFHIAISDLYGNIKPFKDGLLKEEKLVIIAGMGS